VSSVLGGSKPSTTTNGFGVGGETTASLKAPDDPSGTSMQTIERSDEKATVVMVPVERVTETTKVDGTVVRVVETMTPTPVTLSKTVQKSGSSLGASQVDTSKTVSAKLKSMQGVQVIGTILILCSLACFYPPIFMMVRSRILQAALGVVGIGLICLPTLLVGNETRLLYIAIGSLVILLAWYAIHRNALKQGVLDASQNISK
jgi:hypothetical protein